MYPFFMVAFYSGSFARANLDDTSLFNTGTEQHRHNTAEVAVYSVITYLWGLETRGQYTMTKVRHKVLYCTVASIVKLDTHSSDYRDIRQMLTRIVFSVTYHIPLF